MTINMQRLLVYTLLTTADCRYQPGPCSTWENEVFPDPVCIEYYDRLVDKFERIH